MSHAKETAWEPGSTTSNVSPPEIESTTELTATVDSPGVSSKKRGMELLTESRLKTRRRCAREHRLRYELGYESTGEREALRFGDLMHKALEAWWSNIGFGGPVRIEAAIEAIAKNAGEDVFERIRAEELMQGYEARWGEDCFYPIAVEAEFRAPLINPATGAASKTWTRAGKLDVLARDDNGRVLIVEHKTSSDDIGHGSTYWARLRLDGQVSGYFRGAEALGYQAEACMYDVIGKVKIRPYKSTPASARKYTKDGKLYANQREADETPEEYRTRVREEIAANPDCYYQRGEVVRLDDEMREHDLETWQMALMMRDERRQGLAPKNPDACVRYGSLCQFFFACSGEASLEDERLYQLLPSVHPELTD
jgi:hypothetical protein